MSGKVKQARQKKEGYPSMHSVAYRNGKKIKSEIILLKYKELEHYLLVSLTG